MFELEELKQKSLAVKLGILPVYGEEDVNTFEEFLRLAEQAGSADPGTAMMTVLRNTKVPGIDINRISSDLFLNPSGNPGNILKFLCHIAENGQWGVNMDVVIR